MLKKRGRFKLIFLVSGRLTLFGGGFIYIEARYIIITTVFLSYYLVFFNVA
jgi:hypothetical protein